MASQHDRVASADLADQVLSRTIAPAAHNHPHDHDDDEHDDHDHAFELQEMVRIALVALAAAAVWFRLWEPLTVVSVIGIAGLLIGGWPIFKEGFENLIDRKSVV